MGKDDLRWAALCSPDAEVRRNAEGMLSFVDTQPKQTGDLYQRRLILAPENIEGLVPRLEEALEYERIYWETVRGVEQETEIRPGEKEWEYSVRVSEMVHKMKAPTGGVWGKLHSKLDSSLNGIRDNRQRLFQEVCQDFERTFLAMRVMGLLEMEESNNTEIKAALDSSDIGGLSERNLRGALREHLDTIAASRKRLARGKVTHKIRKKLEEQGLELWRRANRTLGPDVRIKHESDIFMGGRIGGEYVQTVDQPFDFLRSPRDYSVYVEIPGGLLEGEYEFLEYDAREVYRAVGARGYDTSRIVHMTNPIHMRVLSSENYKGLLDDFFDRVEKKHQDRVVIPEQLRKREGDY